MIITIITNESDQLTIPLFSLFFKTEQVLIRTNSNFCYKTKGMRFMWPGNCWWDRTLKLV